MTIAQIVYMAALQAFSTTSTNNGFEEYRHTWTADERTEADRIESEVDALELELLDRQTARQMRNDEMECSQW